MYGKRLILIFFAVLSIFSSCKRNRHFAVETEKENIENAVKINRFDSAMLAVDTASIYSDVSSLYRRYSDFLPLYAANILDENPADTALVAVLFKEFVADTVFGRINRMAQAKFADASPYEKQLTVAFAGIRQYFPNVSIPKIYFYVSGFNRSVIYNRDVLGIGIDLYIDSDMPEYQEIAYDYMTVRMCPAAVVPDALAAVLYASFPFQSQRGRLLDIMLYHGKIMYLLAAFLPDAQPNEIIGFSKFQWEWSRKYEADIWETIVGNEDLYSTNNMSIRKYIDPAPFTASIAQESPGRLGIWTGWQIINSYMNANRNVTLQQLVSENDCQKILENAKYNP